MNELIEKHLSRVEGKKSQGTYEKRKVDLKNFAGWLDANSYEDCTSLGWLDLEDYLMEQSNQGYSPNTVKSRFQSLRGLYKFLSKIDEYEDNPMDQLKRSEFINGNSEKYDGDQPAYVTEEEMEAMAENVPKPTLRNELLIRLLWQTGVRRGELISIDLSDIDREERSIDIWSEKTSETRTVFYQPSLDLLLDQWIDGGYRSSYLHAEESDSLFLAPQGRLSNVRLGPIVKEAAENAGIQEVKCKDQQGRERNRITAHSLRHGHAVHALKSGIDIRNLQKHLGHADIERTSEYLQLIDDDVKEAYRQFGVTDD